MQNKTDVKGGPILDTLVDLLFKEANKIFDRAAEYENEMGVLKQVTRLTVNKDGEDYQIAIKLAPIKDKKNMFFVEIDDGGCPGLDFSNYHEKPMKINKSNEQEFERIILDILRDAGVQITDDKGNSATDEIECYKKDKFDDWRYDEFKGSAPKIVTVNATKSPSEKKGTVNLDLQCDEVELTIDGYSLNEDNTSNIADDKVNEFIDKVLKSSGLISIEEANEIKKEDSEGVDNDIESEDLNDMDAETGTPASSFVDVSLSYIKSSDEISLTAIYANNMLNAMDVVQQVIDDDSFVATLTEDPQSFRITDEGDDFDITIIDEVDISNVRNDIYTSIGALSGLLDTYSVDFDAQEQTAADELLSALAKAQSVFQPQDMLDELQ